MSLVNSEEFPWENDRIREILESELVCPDCQSDLKFVRTDQSASAVFQCRDCGKYCSYEDAVDYFVESNQPDSFLVAKLEAEERFFDCPNCGKLGYDFEEQICLFCGQEGIYCEDCNEPLTIEDLNTYPGSGLCCQCNQYHEDIRNND